MNELPRTLLEAVHYFADVDTCNDLMREIKWPDGKIVCPKCGGDAVSQISGRPGLHTCNARACRKQFSCKVDTIFEDSPLPLQKWFVALWYLVNCRNGISSHELGRALGVRQKTAWFMLHRIRAAMHVGSGRKLDGEVESDETYIGGLRENMHAKKREKLSGRGAVGKTAVQVIVQRDGDARAFVPQRCDGENLRGEMFRNVSPGSHVYTDSSSPCASLSWAYEHSTVNHSVGEYKRGRTSTNLAECFFSLLKRAIKGTYVAVSPWHLFRYAEEQGFRFNVRELSDAARFLNLLRGVVGKRLTYRQLCAVGDAGFMGLE